MTDLDRFKQLFTQCRIWRGGGGAAALSDGTHQFMFDINVECKNGKTEYVELIAHFDANGEWQRTTKMSKSRRK